MVEVNLDRINVNDDEHAIRALLVSDGDTVAAGTPIMEVETSKAAVEIEATAEGPIHFLVSPGETVKIGAPICRIGADSDDAPSPAEPPTEKPAPKTNGLDTTTGFQTSRPYKERPRRKSREARAPQLAGPVVPASLQASDPRKAAEIAALSVVNPSGLVSCLFAETAAWRRAADVGPLFENNVSDLIIYEASRLLAKYPRLNARFDENDATVLYDDIRFGYSIDVEDDLTVYNLGDCSTKTMFDLRHAIEDATEAHVTKKISKEQMRESTITLTDLSGSNIRFFLPLINGAQSAIIGYSSGRNNEILISLAFDHRVVGGRYVSQFLDELIARLEAHAADEAPAEVACDVCGRGAEELRAIRSKSLVRIVDLHGNELLCCQNCLEEL